MALLRGGAGRASGRHPRLLTGRRLGEHEGHEEMNRAERLEASGRAEAAEAGAPMIGEEGGRARGRGPRPAPVASRPEPVTRRGGRRPTGRRPGDSATRDAILDAAARVRRARLRRRHHPRHRLPRGGRPCPRHHYFGSKEALFVEALKLPCRRQKCCPRHAPADPASSASTSCRRSSSLGAAGDAAASWPCCARRSPTSAAMGMIRDLLVRRFRAAHRGAGRARRRLRATLVGSQFIGLSLMRYVGRVEPLASAVVDASWPPSGPRCSAT